VAYPVHSKPPLGRVAAVEQMKPSVSWHAEEKRGEREDLASALLGSLQQSGVANEIKVRIPCVG
jgi:hypothetical protein